MGSLDLAKSVVLTDIKGYGETQDLFRLVMASGYHYLFRAQHKEDQRKWVAALKNVKNNAQGLIKSK